MAATSGRHVGKMKKMKDKSPLAILQSVLQSFFLREQPETHTYHSIHYSL